MTISLRPYKRSKSGVWEIDIYLVIPDRTIHRERRRSPVTGKDATMRWARDREASILLD